MKPLRLPRGYRLVAEDDGVGHLVPTRGRPRRACDSRWVDERHGYPVRVRCDACTAAVEAPIAVR